MGLYRQARSPYWWMRVPRRGLPPLWESTKILIDGPTPLQTKRNKELALTIYNTRLGDVARERYDLPSTAPVVDTSKTFDEWADWYDTNQIAQHRGVEREREILATLRATFGAMSLASITRTAVAEWMTARVTPTRSARTVNREVALLKTMLNVAVEHGELDASPIALMPHLHAATRARCVLSREDETKILAAFLTPADKALFLMALDTLVRMGDCLDLRRSDDHGTTLYIRDPKAGEGYRVPVSKRLREALDAVPKDGPYYFTHRRRHTTANARRNGVKKMFALACGKANVAYGRKDGGLTFHWATRRTGATRMLEAGIDFPTVQRVGHWGDPTMLLGIYAESDDARARAAVERIGRDTPVIPIPPRRKSRTKH